MSPARIAIILLACASSVHASTQQTAGATRPMTASLFDGSSRIVVITARSGDAPALAEQRDELLKHASALTERDMVAFVILPGHEIEAVHGPAPTRSDVDAFVRRNPSSGLRDASRFAVALIGKDGGVKFRAERPVRAQELFALIDAMPMRRQEMKR